MKKIILFLAGTLLFASCAKVETEEVVPEKGKHLVTLKATIDEGTRVSVSTTGEYSWQKGDQIAVAVTQTDPDSGEKWSYFVPFTATGSGATTDFEGELQDGDKLGPIALYPDRPYGDPSHDIGSEGDVVFGLGSEYDYCKDVTNMPMFGTVTSNGVSFKALGGLLKIIVENVPEGATSFECTTNQSITGFFDVTENVNGDKQIEAQPDEGWGHNYVRYNLFKSEGNEMISLREKDMEFYIPLPVGMYDSFTFRFYGLEGETPVELVSKTATINGGLQVNRNDIIVPPALVLPAATPTQPNIHDYITFSEATLECFPELGADQPFIRFPVFLNDIFTISFASNYEWYASASNWLNVSKQDNISNSFSLQYDSNHPNFDLYPGTLTFFCGDLQFEILVLPYDAFYIQYNGVDVTRKSIVIPPGESVTLTAVNNGIPVDDITDVLWYTDSEYDYDFSTETYSPRNPSLGIVTSSYLESNPYVLTITGHEIGGSDCVTLCVKYSVGNKTSESWAYVDIKVGPVLTLSDEDGRDLENATIIISEGGTRTVTASVEGLATGMYIVPGSIQVSHNEGEASVISVTPISTENPFSWSITAAADDGEDYFCVELDIYLGPGSNEPIHLSKEVGVYVGDIK